MTNDKDLFSQINDLFEDVTVDQASDLIGEELAPSQSDYEKELIEKLNKNEFQLTDSLVEEIKENIEQGGEVDKTLTQYLRQKFGLAAPEPQQLTEDVLEAPAEVDNTPEKPVREDYIAQYADGLSSVVQRDAMRTTWNSPDDPQMRGDLHERMDALTAQLGILRASLTESTMVSGIGQGGDGQGPGSGEVNINRMDDVCLGPDGISGLNPGDVLVWDPDGRKGEGCWVPQAGEELGTDTSPVFGKIWSCSSLQSPGTLYWGTNADFINNVKTNLVYDGVQSIDYAMALEYDDNGNGTYTGSWTAFGATSNGSTQISLEKVTTNGTSGPNGPEGFYLLGAPCGTGDGTEDCEPGFGTIFGCTKFTEDQPAQLTYGSKDQQELGLGIAITSGPGTDKVVEILRVFSECPQPDNTGEWVCLYNYIDNAGDVRQGQAQVAGKDGPLDNGFYGLGGECADSSGGGDQTERPIMGYISGCKMTADTAAPIKWGTEEQAAAGTGVSVTTPDTMAKEILLVIGKDIADDFTGEWTIWYVDQNNKQEAVTYQGGPSSIVGPEGAYLETDNCADGLPTGECEFAFGKKTGCDEVILGGDLTWGTSDDYTNTTGNVVASDAKKIHVVYSSCVDENNVGQWTCVYEDINGDMLAVVSPVDTESSPEYGFFIAGGTCDGEESGDGRPDNLKFGITTGCKELTATEGEGPLFWGTNADYLSGGGTDTGKVGVAIEFVFSTNANGDNTGDWNIVYVRSTNDREVHSVSGTSPAEGAFLVGDCEVEGGGECEGNNIIGDSNGCIRVLPEGKLYWGEAPVDPDTDVRELVDTEVTQIVAIVGKNVCSNMWGEWYCFYKKGANSSVQVTPPYEGINPEESFYLVPDDGGTCVEDGIDPEPPQQIKPDSGQAIGCYHSQPLPDTETSNVYWADIQSAIELGNGIEKTTTGDIREIVSIFSFAEVDSNGDREWTCLYQKFSGEYGFVVHTGKSPEGGFYLDTPNCVGDPDEITPGEDLVDFIRFGRPVGCDETLPDDTGNLYFGNIVAIADGDDGQVIDPEGDVQSLHFSFTLDKQFSHWNLFYEKTTGTAFIQYPDPAGGTYRSFPWGFHIVDGVCANDELPEPEEPIEGNGKPIEGIYPGCKSTETVGGKPLYWGTKEDAQTGGGVNVSDTEGNPVLDAVRIISTFSFNADNTRYGTWFTIYKKEPVGGVTTYGIATKVGRSPQSGFFIFTDECDGEGILPGGECESTAECPAGMICVGDRCVLKPCTDDLECDGVCIFGYCYEPCNGDCPDGFECVENPLIPGTFVCAPNGGFPGGGQFPVCGEDNDCPPGYQCVGGFCVQLPCSSNGTCPDGMECVFGHCYKPCDPNDPEGCPPGFSCVEPFPGTFICVLGSWPPGGELPEPPPGGGDCSNGEPCPPGYECVGGKCVLLPCPITGCPENFTCVGGHCWPTCDPLNPDSCFPGFECVEINGDFVCLPGGQLPGGSCTEDIDCPPGYYCDPDGSGLCIPKPCTDDGTSCGLVDGVCYQGFCYERCDITLPNPCPPGFTCVDPEGDGNTICMPIGGGGGNCSIDLDCEYGYVCVDGNCVPKRCDGIVTDPDAICGPGLYCFEGVCYPKCENGYICPEGHICVNVGEEYICMPSGGGGPNGCWDTNQCDPGYECIDGTCLPSSCPPIGGVECPEGTICYGGRCYKPCSDTEPCPDGYACVEIAPGLPVCMPIGPDGGGEGGEDTHTLYFGYLPGCKTTGDSAAVLKFGDAVAPAGDASLATDAKSIIFSFAIDDGTQNSSYNPDTGIGDWHCVYTGGNGTPPPVLHLSLSDAGPSPDKGFYLDTFNCTDTEPEQPGANPEEISTQPIGCHKSEPACTLKWGTAEQVVDGSGTEVIDTDVEEILYTGYKNSYPNGYADQVVIYKKTLRATPLQAVRFFQNPDDEGTKGFYLDVVADGCKCVGTGEEHSPTLGLITGCREVSRNGSIYWGTKEDYSDLINELTTPGTTPAIDLGVKAKAILAVVSRDSDDTGMGTWDINYRTFSDEIRTYSGHWGQSPPSGAFILPDEDSVCLLTGDESRAIYTDEVILRKVDNLNEDKDNNFALKGGQSRPAFEHQDSANLYFSQEILDLNRLKPTMIVAEFTGDSDSDPQVAPDYGAEGIPFNYIPVQGDLWLDPTEDDKGVDNIMRAAIVDRTNFNPNNPQITDLKIEWVVVSGGGVGGPGGPVTTDQVYLINTVKFYQAYNDIYPISLEDFTNYFPLITQEDANLVNIDMLKKLQELKPTIHITEEIYSVPRYAPQRGDLWIDPRDYTMYVCDFDVNERPTININPDELFPYQDAEGRYLYWVEVSGSGGSGGNRVMIQMEPPDNAVEGDLWVDEADYLVYVYTPAGSWAALTGDQSAMGKRFSVHVDHSPPVGRPEQGDLWFDTEDSEMRIFLGGVLGDAWIPVSNGGVDRRKALYEESLFEMNKRIQDLNARLLSMEGNSNPMTENFTYPITSTESLDEGGYVDPLNSY